MAVSVTSSVKEFQDIFFDRDKVSRAVNAAVRRQLSRFGAFVRQRSRSSIRPRKAVSEPGSPPTNRTGLLRDFIFFAYEQSTQTVVIGPAKLNKPGVVASLLEYGGSVQGDGRTIFITRDPGRDAVTGQFVTRGRKRVRLDGTMHYKPRPFMNPAFQIEKAKFLDSLKDSVRG